MKKIFFVFGFFVLSVLPVFAEKQDVVFEYKAPVKVNEVYLTGDFADWNANAHKMTYYEAEDIYRIKLSFDEGKYLYKFVVNGTDWKYDVNNPDKVDDGHGGSNSVLKIGDAYRITFNEKKGDGKIREEGVSHEINDLKYFNPYDDGKIRFAIRCAARDVESVGLLITGGDKKEYEMIPFYSDGKFDYFLAYVTVKSGAIDYLFRLKDAEKIEYFGKSGLAGNMEAAGIFISTDAFGNYFRTPEWAKHVVWYQIMVDRFRNASRENDPTFDVLPFSWDWFKNTPKEKNTGFYKTVWDRKFGGDLIGVREKLPYLADLGITGIYFNPVFKSESYQKYNTADFRHIDDTFYQKGDIFSIRGETDDPATWSVTPTDNYFFDFIEVTHKNNIRIIIDGVFNHSGTEMFAFEDLRMKKKESKYADWYKVSSWEPFKYTGWAGFGSLPEFNQDENGLVSPVKEFIFNVTRKWEKPPNGLTGIDGWRLDVPMCVKKPFWQEWRKIVKEANPDAVSIGEIWTDASDWLQGGVFDAVMNYELAKIMVDYFIDKETKISASEFDGRIRELAVRYPQQVAFAQYNLTNSHDTDRLASMIKNPDREYNTRNRLQNPDGKNYDNSPPSKEVYKTLKLMRTFQFAFPGAPAIYYGDEIGMWGADDPNNRKPMWWDDIKYENKTYKINSELKNFMKRIIAVRNTYPVLRTGIFYPVLASDEDDLVVYERILGDETAYIIINNSRKKREISLKTPDDLWDVLHHSGKIKKVAKSDYVKNGPQNVDGRKVFMFPDAKVNCLSIRGKAEYKSKNGRVFLKIRPKTGMYLINKSYEF